MTAIVFPYVTKALRVQQRLGTFYVAVLPAELLLQVAASDSMRAIMKPDGDGYELKGTQRLLQDKRLTEISDYINRVDSAFPNSIIIAANYDLESGFDQGELEYISEETTGAPVDDSRVWSIEEADDGCYTLTIPTAEKLAAIIDGQHRLFSFARAEKEAMQSMDLLCSIFIDLPKALQAQIFATINSNQKKVDRSLTYELFGYNVSDEDETTGRLTNLRCFSPASWQLIQSRHCVDGSWLHRNVTRRSKSLLRRQTGRFRQPSSSMVSCACFRAIPSATPTRCEKVQPVRAGCSAKDRKTNLHYETSTSKGTTRLYSRWS